MRTARVLCIRFRHRNIEVAKKWSGVLPLWDLPESLATDLGFKKIKKLKNKLKSIPNVKLSELESWKGTKSNSHIPYNKPSLLGEFPRVFCRSE